MDAIQHGFQRLGLLPGAEARDIRRAYARELKKIDQAMDAVGFQQLRWAYEAALQFAQPEDVQDVQDEVAHTSHAAVPPATPLQEATPDQLADAVMTEFCAGLAALGTQSGGASDAPYQEALRHALQDERLFGIEARAGFEQRVAILLVQAWRPGHQALLVATAAVFDWRRGARLAGLGQVGAILDRALEERALFDSQSMSTKDGQRRVLRLLRGEPAPDDALIRSYFMQFLLLQERFPHWLPIVTPRAAIVYWQERCAQIVRDTEHATEPPPGRLKVVLTRAMKVLATGLLGLCALAMCAHLLDLFPSSPSRHAEESRRLTAVPGAPIPQERIDDIFKRIDFHPTGEEARAVLAGEYDVFLDTDGRVAGANLVTASGNARFDAAVRAAIMASAPFPAGTVSVFALTFKHTPRVDMARKPP